MIEVHSAPKLPRPGDRIAGKYRVEHMLGAGGMGCVLAAEHLVLKTRVAIKLLLPQAAEIPGATERFLREAQAAAGLRSEHVARVLDVGSTEAGAPFLVMEHLTGQDLRTMIRERGPLPVGEVVEFVLQTCDAVLEAHARGIIHRDLKPANIFVTTRPNGAPLLKVLDFGLAKVLDPARGEAPEESITHSGMVVGSPHYMSPEQFRSLRNADVRSDIWAMGVIMYEMATGKRPFTGEGMSGVMMAVVTEEPTPPRALRPDLPEPLEALILRCLDKTPDNRPQWMAEIVAALESLALAGPSSGTFASPSSARRAADADIASEPAPRPTPGPEEVEPRAAPALTAMVPGPGVLPPAPGRSTWRMVDSSPEEIAAIRAVIGEPGTAGAPTTGSDPGPPSTSSRSEKTGRGSRRWLAAGLAAGTLVAALGGGLVVLRSSTEADARGPTAATPEVVATASAILQPAATQAVSTAVTITVPPADSAPPPGPAATATASVTTAGTSTTTAAPAAEASAPSPKAAGAKGAPASPRPTAKPVTKPAAKPASDDPLGKYD